MPRKIKKHKKAEPALKPSPPRDLVTMIQAPCGCALLICSGLVTWVRGCDEERLHYEATCDAGVHLFEAVEEAQPEAGSGKAGQLLSFSHEHYRAIVEQHHQHLMGAFAHIVQLSPFNLFGVTVYYPLGGLADATKAERA